MEMRNGYRMTWHNLPANRVWSQRLIVPPSILYNPGKEMEDI